MNELFPKKYIDALPAKEDINNPLVASFLKDNKPSVTAFRNQIERWYNNLPEEAKADIGSRLRSLDNQQHLPAFYELMLHQFLIEEDCLLKHHPKLDNKTPDYLVMDLRSSPLFYLEIATVFQDKDLARKERNFDRLLKEINKIKHYFFVSIHLKQWLPEKLKYSRIKQDIKKWLDKYNPKTTHAIHKLTYKIDNCELELELIPKKEIRKDPIVGSWMWPGYSGPVASKQIRNAIQSKIRKYKAIKQMNLPLVIAICSSGEWATYDNHLESELFGREIVVWKKSLESATNDAKVKRDLSGLLVPTPTFPEARNKRLSAILYCERIWREIKGEYRMVYNMKLYHNPWANIELKTDVFDKIPQLVKTQGDKEQIVCQWLKDNKQVVIFNS